MKIRVGFGYDVHRLEEGKDFWLGGIKVPHTHGAVGHSDADVLIHVICDALLGAANLRDIGFHFSDKDPKFKGIDSKILLKEVVALVEAGVMGMDEEDISIKATTTEKLGFVGKAEGVAAYATVLIQK